MGQKTSRKFEGVMLALTIEDATFLSDFIGEKLVPISAGRMESENRIAKISERIEKQIEKRMKHYEDIGRHLAEEATKEKEEEKKTLPGEFPDPHATMKGPEDEAEKYAQENRIK